MEKGWGRMAIVSSPSAEEAPARGLPYSVSRAGEEAILKTLAHEVKGTSVTANVVRVRTIDDTHSREKEASQNNKFWTTPEEIAAMLEFLCTNEGGRINGAVLPMYAGG
jgi:3-oxoacyl-[acyl-carrier protein] reductase